MIISIFPPILITALLMMSCMCTAAEYDFETDCRVHEYDGGPGQVIATFKPTLPGEISLDSSSNAWDIASDVASNIPIVGGALGSLFSLISTGTDTTVDNMQELKTAINELIKDIRQTVDDLKDYVDAKFNEYDYDKKAETLNGILFTAGYCANFNKPDNQEECLKSLNVNIAQLVPTFFPVDEPKYETFEQLLPLTRHYIDLQMAVLVDIINITVLDQDYVDYIATFSIMAYNFYVTSVETIVQEHNVSSALHLIQFEEFNSKPGMWPEYCETFDYSIGTQEWDHGDGCSIMYPIDGCPYHGCFDCHNKFQIHNILIAQVLGERLYIYAPQLAKTIRKYWKADMGQAMENYKKIGILAGANEDDYLVMGESFMAEEYIPEMKCLMHELQEKSKKHLPKKPYQYSDNGKRRKYKKLQSKYKQKPCRTAEEN